jgi:uncharacterized protein
MLAFLSIVSVLWIAFHVILPLRLMARDRTRGVPLLRLALSVACGLLSLATLGVDRVLNSTATLVWRWIGWTYIGAFTTLFALLVARALVIGVLSRAARGERGNAVAQKLPSPERRAFLARASSTASFGVAAAATGYGVREARRLPEVVEVEVPIAGLPARFDGYHIAQISDIHVGLTIDKDTILPVVEAVTSLGADLVVVTGDVVDGSVEDLREDISPLAYLRARDGVLCVTGNHEYYSGAEAWCAHFERGLGMRVLNNSHLVLKRGDDTLVVAGVTDYGAGRLLPSHASDPEAALRGAPAGTRILLAHQPRSAYAAAKAGFALQLSGHTHGGQFFPWNLLVGLVQPVSKGLAKIDGMWVYVNRGTGYWGPPVRSGVPAEITSIKLRRA